MPYDLFALRVCHSWGECILVTFRFLFLFSGSFWINLYYKLLGARIAPDALLMGTVAFDHDLIHIDKKAVLDEGASIHGHLYQDWLMTQGISSLNTQATLSVSSYMHCGDVIESNGTLLPLSKMLRSNRVKKGEMWHGFPARKVVRKGIKRRGARTRSATIHGGAKYAGSSFPSPSPSVFLSSRALSRPVGETHKLPRTYHSAAAAASGGGGRGSHSSSVANHHHAHPPHQHVRHVNTCNPSIRSPRRRSLRAQTQPNTPRHRSRRSGTLIEK
uniref:Uncharacterized protein n=1 Tax=Lotharella globosa TaxID=91324 RepID=A0A7S3YN87_9EUKA